MSNNLIPINPQWDYQPKLDLQQGQHIIREKEQKLLLDFLGRRKEGALLISGRRGVGKSSTVFSAVNKLVKQFPKQKLFPILINAPSFEFVSGNEPLPPEKFPDFKKSVFQSFIRSIYRKSINSQLNSELNSELKEKISKLYRRAIAKTVKEEYLSKDSDSTEKIFQLETKTSFGIKKLLVIIGSILFALGFLSFPINELGFLQTVIAVLIGIVPSIALAVKSKYSKTSSSEKTASEYYLNDFDIGNLQAELEHTLYDLQVNEYKSILIVDELDKMNEGDVINVVKSIKSLINNGNAIFVFITGFEFFDLLKKLGRDSKEYTLFSQRIFLQRPSFEDMEKFLDIIIWGELFELVESGREEEYRKFRNYACFAAKSDFFDLYNVIRDHISGYDKNGSPLLDITIKDEFAILGNLQKVLGQIFSRSSYEKVSDWRKNDLLLDHMYDLLNKILDSPVHTAFVVTPNKPWTITIPTQNDTQLSDETEFNTINSMLKYLVRLQFLSSPAENQFEIIGTLKEVPLNPSALVLEHERFFGQECERLQRLALFFANMISVKIQNSDTISVENYEKNRNSIFKIITNAIGVDLTQFNNIIDVYDQFTSSKFPPFVRREEMQAQTKQLVNAENQLLQKSAILVSRVFNSQLSGGTVQDLPNLTQINKMAGLGMDQNMIQQGIINSVITVKANGVQKNILIAQNIPENIKPRLILKRKENDFFTINLRPAPLNTDKTFSLEDESVQKMLDVLENLGKEKDGGKFENSILEVDFPISDVVLEAISEKIVSWLKGVEIDNSEKEKELDEDFQTEKTSD